MTDQVKGGLLGLVFILASFGGVMLLDKETLDHAYYCPSDNSVGIFIGNANHPAPLSSTLKTGYYIDEDGSNKRAYCSDAWIPLKEYAKSKGINPERLISSAVTPKHAPAASAGTYICKAQSCEAIP